MSFCGLCAWDVILINALSSRYTTRYRPELDPVLNDVSFTIVCGGFGCQDVISLAAFCRNQKRKSGFVAEQAQENLLYVRFFPVAPLPVTEPLSHRIH